jgi:hypothetical protein
MARKATYAQITRALTDAAECYNKAANGMQTVALRDDMTGKWAMLRAVSIILASRNANALNDLLDTAKGWQKSGEDCLAEVAKARASRA